VKPSGEVSVGAGAQALLSYNAGGAQCLGLKAVREVAPHGSVPEDAKDLTLRGDGIWRWTVLSEDRSAFVELIFIPNMVVEYRTNLCEESFLD